jgi:hypothetical protein
MLFAFGLAACLASNLPAGEMLKLKLIPDRAVRLKKSTARSCREN